MKVEKAIKLQARHYLSQNNWSTAIGCLAVSLFAAFFIIFLYYCLLYGFDTVDLTTFEYKSSKMQIVNIIEYGIIFLFVFASPILSGYTKVCYNIAKYGTSNTYDIFYYFSRPRLYFRALGVNLLKLAIFIPLFVIGLVGYLFIDVAVKSGTPINENLSLSIGIGILLADVIVFLVLYAKFIFVNYVLAENSYNSTFFCFSESISLTNGHTISTIKLILSFTLWYILCFFVLPIFYVIPYVKVSVGTSAKWLMTMRKEEFR